MQIELFLNFNGNCREALDFYSKIFKSEVHNLMTYAEAPPMSGYPVTDENKDKIMYAGIPADGMTLMFMDLPEDMPVVAGNNITPTISVDEKDEVTRIFNGLKEGGEVVVELQKAFFSAWYGMVKDKFGIIWQILHYVPQEQNA